MLKRVFLLIILLTFLFSVLFIISKPSKPVHTNEKVHSSDEQIENKEENAESKAYVIPAYKQETKIEKKVKEEKPLTEKKDELADLHIVGLGDSLTQGVGDSFKEGYIGIVEQKMESESNLQIELHNFAKRGQRSDQLLRKLTKKDVLENIKEADYIFLTIGGNDLMGVFKNHFFHLNINLFEKQSEKFQKNLQEILTIIRYENPSAPVYMIGLFNPYLNYFSDIVEINEIVNIWNEASRRVIGEFSNTHFVSIDSIFKEEEEFLLYEDFFHPNRLGYELIADRLLNQMRLEGDFVYVSQQ